MLKMESGLGTIARGLLCSAKSAVAHLALRTLHEPSGATRVVRIQRSDVRKVAPLVYDLSVKDHRCYLANGLLVSNSDSFQVLSVGLKKAMASGGTSDLSDPDYFDAAPPLMPSWQPDGEVF